MRILVGFYKNVNEKIEEKMEKWGINFERKIKSHLQNANEESFLTYL